MKKEFESVRFIFKVILLMIILVFGWMFVNVASLAKGKRTVENADDLWGFGQASADVPSGGDEGSY